jgi:hypothetical protein
MAKALSTSEYVAGRTMRDFAPRIEDEQQLVNDGVTLWLGSMRGRIDLNPDSTIVLIGSDPGQNRNR